MSLQSCAVSTVALSALCAFGAEGGTLYKCVDSRTKAVLYSSEPCPPGSQVKKMDPDGGLVIRDVPPPAPQYTAPSASDPLPAWRSDPPPSPPATAQPNPLADFIPDPPKRIWPLQGSWSKCILEKMPGVANDVAASYIVRECSREYPEIMRAVESGGLLDYRDGAACVADKARNTSSLVAARTINAACTHRYGPPK